jgi:5-methylcytosine-specific restriction endonuclease McrA
MTRAWTEDELALLRDTSLTLMEVARRTGRPIHGVENRAYRAGISRREVPEVWTEAELTLLHDTTLTYQEISARTGWPERSVEYKARQMGVLRGDTYRSWTEAELALIDDLSLSYADVVQRTGRSHESVRLKANRRGAYRRTFWSVPGYQPGHSDYRGEDWPKVRTEVLERDGCVCQDGGEFFPSGKGLVVHHVIPYRLRPSNDLRWLVTLCMHHHMLRPEHSWSAIPEDVLLLLAEGR